MLSNLNAVMTKKNELKILLFVVFTITTNACLKAQKSSLMNGTIIITLVSNDTIWLGADSRTTSLTEKGYTVNKDGMCKVYSTNDIVYAMAGHVRYVDNSFNFLNLMRDCIYQQKDFEKSLFEFQERTKIKIGTILKKFSKKSIQTLVKTNKGSFLSVVAVSFANGEKKVKELQFSIEPINNKWNILSKSVDANDVGSLRFMGHATNALEFVKNNQLYFGNGRNIPDKINDLIKLESEKGTITVGMPADVISIYNNGFKRIISSGLCQ